MKKLLKKCWIPLAIVLIVLAILFSVFRALTPWATQYKTNVEQHLTQLVGQSVAISSMETSWYWFEPVLRLNDVTITDAEKHILQFNKLLVGINLFSSLWHWHVQPGILYLDDAHIVLHQTKQKWQVDGLHTDKQVTLEPNWYMPVLGWLLGQKKIIVKNVSTDVYLEDGSVFPLQDINITAVNRKGRYRLKGRAKLARSAKGTELSILADLALNPYALDTLNGEAYVSLRHFYPKQWQKFFPKKAYRLDSGMGNIEAWFDVTKGRLTGVQTTLDIHQLAWRNQATSSRNAIPLLQGNFAWKPTHDGWQLSGDKIQLQENGTVWPENSLVLNYTRDKKAYRGFIQHLLLKPLFKMDIAWPDTMQPLLALHPSGSLHDMQFEVQLNQLQYFLTRFSDVSWRAQKSVPAVRHVSGVFHWQPSEGRLDLDANDAVLAPNGYPAITFTRANASIAWKKQEDDFQVSMQRFLLSHPSFDITARGTLDHLLSPTNRSLHLKAEYSADELQHWFAYIPARYLKPKLQEWMTRDIQHIHKASGQITVDGRLSDFPFDKQPGEFAINSRLSGVDLFFNRQWPLCHDVDAYLHVNKRLLEVNILQSDLKGMLLDKANFNIADIGLDKETLLFHGTLDTPAPKAMAYVLDSPLRKHLGKLSMLDMQGELGLDLHLEVPLYPGDNAVLAEGDVSFRQNQITIHHHTNAFTFEGVTGQLAFNQHGVTDSDLQAVLFHEPVAIRIQSNDKPKPHTEVAIRGKANMQTLRTTVNAPILARLQGAFAVESRLILNNAPNESDRMQITSSLQGVAVDLPPPFGKSAETETPTTLEIDMADQQAMRVRFNYANRLSSDLSFTQLDKGLTLDKGDIHIGSGDAQLTTEPGINVTGSLDSIDVKQWQSIVSGVHSDTASSVWMRKLHSIDMTLGKLQLWDNTYPNVAMYFKQVEPNVWSLRFIQRDIAGDVRYQVATNTISGRLGHLYLHKSTMMGDSNSVSKWTLQPKDIPNLNLTIDHVKLDDIEFGSVGIKSTSTAELWHLEEGSITSPDYQLQLKGDWRQSLAKKDTTVDANLKIVNLAKSLQRWHIMPVVEAHQASVQFTGGWPGAVYDFSLARLNGHAFIMLKDGRITHLGPETENKLGLGKLLSILSLQTIPRRLKLDFSDLSNDGYTYDEFKGNFTLKNGVMTTDDSYVDGPVAYASMKGGLDLAKQLYDIELHISPHVTASLPMVATIAGGPIVGPIAGMATWVATKLINQGMQRVTGYTYKVTGPWLDPVVQQVSIVKKKTK